MLKRIVLLIAVFITFAVPAKAGCVWEFQCDAYGNCRQVAICDSSLDLVPIKPSAVPPIVSPSIAPVPQSVVPAVGTTSCRQVRLCDSWGNCSYQMVCN